MGRELTYEDREVVYNKLFKQRDKAIAELQREVELTREKLASVDAENSTLGKQLQTAGERNKAVQVKRAEQLR